MVSEVPVKRSADEPTEEGVRTVEEGTSPAAAMRPSRPSVSPAHTRAEQLAMSAAGQGTDPDDHPGQPASKAVAWLRTRGAGGETLLALAETLSTDPSAWDQRIRRNGEQLVVLFPDGLRGLGAAPQAHLDALASTGLLDVNPLTPLRRVTQIDGQYGALLTLEASRQVLAVIADAWAPVDAPSADPASSQPEARNLEPAKPTAAPADPREPLPADAARDLVKRIRAHDPTLPRGVSQADGWLCVGPETLRSWAQAQGVPIYVLIRTLGHLPGCRVTPDGGLAVRETP
jgi:conjugal transfer pilus assembly protein TraI